MIIEQTSKFCPHCSNPKAVDGSYQDIGTFSIMERVEVRCYLKKCYSRYFKWECENCGYEEEIE